MTLQRSGTAGVNCDFIKIIVFWDMWGNSVWCAKRAIRPNSWWISEDVIIAWLWSLKQKHTLPDHRPVLLKVKQNIRYFHSGHHREKSRLNLNAVHFNFIVCLFVFAHTYLRTRCLLRVRVKCLSPKQRGQSDIGLQKLPETMPLASGLRFEVFPNTQQLHVETPTCTDTHTLTDTQDVQLRWW